ncbi:MAG: secondary thiamine-phosphate synthase enzyme YjbQ [Candidatus Lokiarchaeota archaeon]|nr:secondary thiamine-phosphate synthase enzyme YjbQ [Candidatus Lokiarchaeota archaeon]
MAVIFESFKLSSKAYCDVINITQEVQSAVSKSGIKDGLVNVHIGGSTGAISTTEYEPGLVQHDIKEFLERVIPYDKNYKHHRTWGDNNGAGHLRSFLLKTSQTFPFKNQQLILGTWQQIIFIECDEKSRSRTIYCTIVGE